MDGFLQASSSCDGTARVWSLETSVGQECTHLPPSSFITPLTPPHSSSLLLTPPLTPPHSPPHSSSLLLTPPLTPPHSSSLLLTPPHSSPHSSSLPPSLLLTPPPFLTPLTPPHSPSLLLTPPHSSQDCVKVLPILPKCSDVSLVKSLCYLAWHPKGGKVQPHPKPLPPSPSLPSHLIWPTPSAPYVQVLAIPVGEHIKLYARDSWDCIGTLIDEHHKTVRWCV